MAEYTMGDIFEDVVITIEGSKFRLRERTKALGEKVDKLQVQFNEMPDDAPDDEAVVPMIDLLDVLLEPLGDGNNGTRTHAKTIVKKEFDADRWGSDRIIALANFCQKKMGDRMDPFSDQPTVG